MAWLLDVIKCDAHYFSKQCSDFDLRTFASVPFEQTVSDELGTTRLQSWGLLQRLAVQAFSLHLPLADQLWSVQGQGSEQQPGVVVDIWLDQPVTIADSNGHHRIYGDPMSRQVTIDENIKV